MSGKAGKSRWVTAATVIVGLLVGVASAVVYMRQGIGRGESYSGWMGSAETGSADADPWTRARVAVAGILALNKSQAIYFSRGTDEAGERLREDCRYQVSGGPLPGRWWSVTVYAADNFLPQNDDDALSFDATEVTPDAQGRWSAIVSARRPEGSAWASSRKAGAYDLTLRIYQPTEQAQADFASIPMPKVTKLDCGGQA